MRITQALVRAVTVAPNRTATIDGMRVRTWREVFESVGRTAGGLANRGVSPGDRVAVLAHNCDAFFDAYFAVPWAGAVLTPLNTRLAPPELAFQLKDAGVRLLLFGREFEDVALRLRAEGAVEDLIALDDGSPSQIECLADLRADLPMPEVEAGDTTLAGIFYTGGTTGLPKGVMLSHGNLHTIASNLLMSIPYDGTCVNLHATPMFHLADIGILMATMAGGAHVFERSLQADVLLEAIARHRVTHCFTVPAVLDRLARAERSIELDLSSLRVLGYGGSSLPAASFTIARQRFPDVDFVQGFGQTEMAAATFLSPRDHRADADLSRLRSAGQVCMGYEIRIVDEDGQEVPRGVVGEIVGRGGNVMMGYWRRPDETVQALRGGWLHTGDTGYMDNEGYIYVVDRLKDMIVSGAENVYSIEVENAISWHPAIEESAVIGVPDSVWGERVHAIIVPKRGASPPDLVSLVAFCREHIAGYKCPKSLEVRSEPLPRSAIGKILKTSLRTAR